MGTARTSFIWAVALLVAASHVPAQELVATPMAELGPILATYDFEEPIPSGPDTFWLREGRGGSVDLSAIYRFSGDRSLSIREAPGNRDFAEFLGYFEERHSGAVFIQFYVLFTDLEERFNFGLAGRRWFLNRERHGHAVWLETRDGKLWHRPAHEWRELFTPHPFVWYFVDLMYDIDRGTYDLRVFEEGCGEACTESVVDVRDQKNTADAERSSVRYFSFIGDLEDEGRFDYFVDDLLVASDPSVLLAPFVAPGRRKFFVERFAENRGPLTRAERDDLAWEAEAWLMGESSKSNLVRIEWAADEAFLAGDLHLAYEIYQRLRTAGAESSRILLKLSDVAHLRGEIDEERKLRESIYGRLDFEGVEANTD